MIKQLSNTYKKIKAPVKASFWFLICSFLQRGISVITTPIFTRLLTTAEYGNYNVFNSWLSIVTIFVTLHLYSGVYTQGLVKNSENRNVYSSSLQGLTLVLSFVWTFIYLMSRDFWNSLLSLTTVQMLAMLVMIWSTAVFNFWAAEQRVNYKYKALVLVTLIISLAKPLIGILFVIHANDKVTARILGLALVELIGYFPFFIIQMKRGKVFYSREYWGHALRFNIVLVPHYLSQTVLNSSDRIMIKTLVDESSAGIYSLAYSISQIMTLFNTALVQTLNPWIYQKIKDYRVRDIESVGVPALGCIAIVNILLIAFAPEVVSLFAPPSYHEAINLIPPIAISVYFMFSYSLFAAFEFYFEKTKYIALATSVGAVLNILMNYIFINIFGYQAAAYTTLLCYILYSCFHYIAMRKICNEFLNGQKVYNPKTLIILSAGFLIFGFLLLMTYSNAILRYSLVILIIGFIFFYRHRIKNMILKFVDIRKRK